MIVISATAAGITTVAYTGVTRWERTIENLCYQAIAPMVERIDLKLRKTHARTVRQLSRRNESQLTTETEPQCNPLRRQAKVDLNVKTSFGRELR